MFLFSNDDLLVCILHEKNSRILSEKLSFSKQYILLKIFCNRGQQLSWRGGVKSCSRHWKSHVRPIMVCRRTTYFSVGYFPDSFCIFNWLKGIVQRDITAVVSSLKQSVLIDYLVAKAYFFILKGHHSERSKSSCKRRPPCNKLDNLACIGWWSYDI
jgi:hypothetical protein